MAACVVAVSTACEGGDPMPGAAPPTDPPLLELRLAYPDSAAGRRAVEHGGQVYYLDATPVVTDADFRDVRTAPRGDHMIVSVRLGGAAARRLHDATADHIGRPMALLARSRLLSVPVVQSALGAPADARIQIGGIPLHGADGLADAIRARWPEDDH